MRVGLFSATRFLSSSSTGGFMKRFSSVGLIGLIGVTLAAGGCSLSTEAPGGSVALGIDNIEAPERIAAGTPLDVVLTVVVGGCLVFEDFLTNRTGDGASVIARGRDERPSSGSCTEDLRPEPHSVRFEPPFGSTFTVTALRPLQEPLTATVQID
jgi:hypothetical protein